MLTRLLMMAITLSLIACNHNKDESDNEAIKEINPPRITISLPSNLSSVMTNTENKSNNKPLFRAEDDSGVDCNPQDDEDVDIFEDGYQLTRFVIDLSQSVTCFADVIMQKTLEHATPYIGLGLVEMPENDSNPDSPTKIRIDKSGNATSVWLIFTVSADVDINTDELIYLTWIAENGVTQGSFYFINIENDSTDPEAPDNIRVDFLRDGAVKFNDIYMDLPGVNDNEVNNFRLTLEEDSASDIARYVAESLLTLKDGSIPFENIPLTETLETPLFHAITISDIQGAGSSLAKITDFAIHLSEVKNEDGDEVDVEEGDFRIGTYAFDLNNKMYFDVDGETQWQEKWVNNAKYVNTSGENTRLNASTVLDLVAKTYSLDDDYFAKTCTDDNDADCTLFLGAFFEQENILQIADNNDSSDEPDDGRKAEMEFLSSNDLDSVFPADETEETIYTIPEVK